MPRALPIFTFAALTACHDDVNLGKLPESGTQASTSAADEGGPTTSDASTTGTSGTETSGDDTTGETTGCETSCGPPTRFAFVTSEKFTGDLGGLTGADAKCQMLADAAGLPGTYMAWLSDDTGSPATRMTRSKGPYVLPNGAVVVDSWDALTADPMAPLQAPITMTETMGVPPVLFPNCGVFGCSAVWTNTTRTGTLATAGGSCSNWAITAGGGNFGDWGEVDAFWTFAGWGLCTEERLLYCFEQ